MAALRDLCSGALVAALVLAVPGCSGEGRPVKVNGVVTLDGKPLSDAVVRFIPEDKNGREATGVTGADGTFRLSTFRSHDGALPGQYKVTVQQADATDVPPGLAEQIQAGGKTIKDAMDAFKKARAGTKRKPITILARYRDPAKTELKETVPAGGEVVLELKSK
jgi:hypothetical protein